ncbi:DUF349 domain-containing protein [Balneolaceae bacterium ANBcel3]|nr:DUF349 domain-containing protein [Balneolaceae bacterium ANBcel3]
MNTVELMEKEFSIVTADGHVRQKDNAFFSGNELTKVSSEEAEEAVAYFEKEFQALEKYVSEQLKILIEEEPSQSVIDKLEELREDVVKSRSIGDFSALLTKIEDAKQKQKGLAGQKEEVQEVSSDDKAKVVPEEEDPSTEELNQESSIEETEEPAQESAVEDKEDQEMVLPEYSEKLEPIAELVKGLLSLPVEENWQQAKHELDNVRFKWDEIAGAEEGLSSEKGYQELMAVLDNVEQKIFAVKNELQEKRKERKKANVEKRAELLGQLQEIIDKKKWQAFKEINSISNRWENIKVFPADAESDQQDKKFQELMDEFNEKKVELLVKKAQKEEENLAGKLAILDKMSLLVSSSGPDTKNWDKLDIEVEELARQWKKIGHVPLEQSDVIWDKFKKTRDDYFDKKFEHNEAFRKQTVRNIRKKEKICEEAEALLEEKDLATAVREMNGLHKRWKKIGAGPKDKNDELWERFNEATQKFNKVKSENQEVIKGQEQQNLEKKLALCEKAESLKDSTSWNETSRELDGLMEEWKKIGPIPRRKAGKAWKRFKSALDAFYENRRSHYKVVREEQKKNYDQKREIVKQIEALADLDDPKEAVQKTRELQDAFKEIGFVPIKKKSKLDKEYKLACDVIYQRARKESRTGAPAQASGVSKEQKGPRDEFFKLKKECDKLQEEILRYKDTMTFINPGGQGNALIEDVQKKIDKAQKELEKKQKKLEELRSDDGSQA